MKYSFISWHKRIKRNLGSSVFHFVPFRIYKAGVSMSNNERFIRSSIIQEGINQRLK